MNTCFALATPKGKSGVAIIRISGPRAFDVMQLLHGNEPEFNRASLRKIVSNDGAVLDEALVIFFEKGKSFTGENSVELQIHGSIAVINAIMTELASLNDFKLAEPGEFTRKALLNGRLDMTQVEGLADLIEAETETQRTQAMRVFSGELGQLTDGWRKSLIRAAALIEATIDFADEDVPVDVSPEVNQLLASTRKSMEAHVNGYSIAERIRDGFEVAIVGAPNAGKSTLLNSIAKREAAIVSDIAGTTRDVIEVRMDLDGIPVSFLDTAGLRETADVVENIGISRAIERAQAADLRVFLMSDEDFEHLSPSGDDIVLTSKSDLNSAANGISGKTGEGVSELLQQISDIFADKVQYSGAVIRERQIVALKQALSILNSDFVLNWDSGSDEMFAEELRSCVRVLDVLIGNVDVENVLDEIFASFCLGK